MDGERRLRPRHTFATSVLLVSVLLALTTGSTSPPPIAPPVVPEDRPSPVAPLPFTAPVAYEPIDGDGTYLSRGPGYTVAVRPTGATFTAAGTRVGFSLRDANPDPAAVPGEQLPGVSHYLVGPDTAHWRRAVPRYSSVRYQAVYPGIDLVFHSGGTRLEYDFVVAPGADPDRIRLQFDGPQPPRIDDHGRLITAGPYGQFVQERPVIYQDTPDGLRTAIDGGFVLEPAGEASFSVGPYDPTRTLVIDPVLDYSTYLGGSSTDTATGVAVDGAGNIYVTGLTASADFPRRGGLPLADPGGEDAFVTKFDPLGQIIYSTYFGGSARDQGNGIAVDSTGAVSIVGGTDSTDLPLANAIQTAFNGQRDAFVAKLAPSGSSLVFSTYLGGSSLDYGNAIDTDASGRVWVAGSTHSPTFPGLPPSPRDTTFGDAYVLRFVATGVGLDFAALLGGSGSDTILDLALDTSGAAYVGGITWSKDLPTTPGAVIPTNPSQEGIPETGFVAKFDSTAAAPAYLSYLGGEAHDAVNGVAVDANGSVYATGYTTSHDFPQLNRFQHRPDYQDEYDQSAFVTKLNPSATAIVYSSFLGGTERDIGVDIDVDAGGRAYVVGVTSSPDFPAVDAMQPFRGGPPGEFTNRDAFVVRVAAAGSTLEYATWLGGSDNDRATGVAADSSGRAVVAGVTSSSNFPVAGSPIQARNGLTDGFITRVGAQLAAGSARLLGSTRFADGSFDKEGGGGASVSAFAVNTSPNKPHQLVSAPPGGCSSGSGLVPVNPAIRHSNGRGLIATTSGEIHRPPGEYEVCFRAVDGQTATGPAFFSIL